jgi:hypothetical protein
VESMLGLGRTGADKFERRFAHLGYGFTQEDRDPDASTTPYLTEDAIDDQWMAQFAAKIE